jgi:hypothetical protein
MGLGIMVGGSGRWVERPGISNSGERGERGGGVGFPVPDDVLHMSRRLKNPDRLDLRLAILFGFGGASSRIPAWSRSGEVRPERTGTFSLIEDRPEVRSRSVDIGRCVDRTGSDDFFRGVGGVGSVLPFPTGSRMPRSSSSCRSVNSVRLLVCFVPVHSGPTGSEAEAQTGNPKLDLEFDRLGRSRGISVGDKGAGEFRPEARVIRRSRLVGGSSSSIPVSPRAMSKMASSQCASKFLSIAFGDDVCLDDVRVCAISASSTARRATRHLSSASRRIVPRLACT